MNEVRWVGSIRVATGLIVLAIALVLAAPAQGASGTWDRTWGKDVITGGTTGFEVCILATDCQTGIAGSLGGEFNGVAGVSTDLAGNVYVAETGNDRVQKFDSAGNFLFAIGKDVIAGSGSGNAEICTVAVSCKQGETTSVQGGEFSNPSDVATDPANGDFYVADSTRRRVQKFDSSGNFLAAWGKDVKISDPGTGAEICTVATDCKGGVASGTLGGEFETPAGIETDAAGNVYVAEGTNNRVQKLNSSGTFLLAWGKDVKISDAGTGPEICTVASDCKAGTLTTAQGGEFNNPTDVATIAAGAVFVSDDGNERIQKFDLSGNFQLTWGKDVLSTGGTGEGEVCSTAASCQAGTSATSVNAQGGEFAFGNAAGVAADAAENVYVPDRGNARIQRFDSLGNFQMAWGKDVSIGTAGTGFEICTAAADCQASVLPSTLGGELSAPNAAAAHGSSVLYVAEQSNVRISKFADPSAGSGSGGSGPAVLALPSNLFAIGKVVRRAVTLTVPGPGGIQVKDAAAGAAGATAVAAKARRRLNPSSATAGAAGQILVVLRLTKFANKLLRLRGKVTVKAAISFTPTGGTTATQTAKLKIKKKR